MLFGRCTCGVQGHIVSDGVPDLPGEGQICGQVAVLISDFASYQTTLVLVMLISLAVQLFAFISQQTVFW